MSTKTIFITISLLTAQASFGKGNFVLAVSSRGITNTQAVLSYVVPDSNPCSVQVSPSPTFSPLVYDVDPSKFPASNLDSRSPLGGSSHRIFVVGQRVAQRALDQNFYSRALQEETTYYYQVSCTADGVSTTGQFKTTTVAFGNSYADPMPVDPTKPGEYAWPTLSLTDRTQQIVDPQTGVLLGRMSLPEDRNLPTPNAQFVNVRTAGWANGPAALNGNDGNAAATVTGDNVSPLLLLPQDNVNFYGYINSFHGTHSNNTAFLNWFQVTLNAATSNAGCATDPLADCNIQVCLTIDGVNCNPRGQTFSQALTPTLTNYTFGSSGTAIDLWQNPGQRPFNGTEIAIRVGGVNCTGSSTVTWAGGDYFPIFWTAGSVITINGVNYPIQQVNNTENLQLTGTCPSTNGQPAPYTGMNFGVIVRKQTTSPDTISIQYGSANYDTGVFPVFDFTGEYDLCSSSTVVGPTGKAGYNCSMIQNGQVFWIDGKTAETHLLALNQGNFAGPSGSCGAFDSIIFDSTNPDIWYCGGPYPQRMQYFGNHSDPMNTLFPGFLQEQVNLPGCNSPVSPTNEPCLVTAGLTGTTPLSTIIAAFDPTFDPVAFSQPYLSHVENGLLVVRVSRSDYGSLGWTVMFDPNATSNSQPNNAGCVGGGLPGCVVAAVSSWTTPAARWCALKSNDPMNVPGWSALGGYGWGPLNNGIAGMGPYLSTVNDGTAFTLAPNTPGGPSPCPVNSLGVTGNACTTVQVDGSPYNPYPCVASVEACYGEVESGAPGAIGNAAVGDFFVLNYTGSEIMRLIAISATNPNEWTFQRAYNNVMSSSGANPQLVTQCNASPFPANVNGGSEWYWNYAADPHGQDANRLTTINDPNGMESHFFIQNGLMVNTYTLDPACGPPPDICYQDRFFSNIPQLVAEGPTTVQTTNPTFNGVTPPSFGNFTQSHPAGPGWTPSSQNANYFFDGRPFNAGPLSGSATGNGSNPATLVSGTLWKFTSAQVPQLHRKLNATFAFSGYKTLLDVSGPQQGSAITGNPVDNYKYCVVNVAGECIGGSQAGDVYINAPYVEYPYCNFPSQASNMADEFDLCIGDNGMTYNSLMEMNQSVTDPTGATERMLSKGLSRARITVAFWHPHAIANSNFLYFKDDYAQDVGDMILTAKVPEGSPDSVNRLQFEPATLKATQSAPGTATAYVEFGYAEDGAPANLYCTTRAEVCAAANAAGSPINLTTPFFFETTEESQIKPVPCVQACSITVPALPQHVLYFRWVFLNSALAVISKSGIYANGMN